MKQLLILLLFPAIVFAQGSRQVLTVKGGSGGSGGAGTTDASAITDGTLSDARLSPNVLLATSTHTILNKNISGATNTITNIPIEAIPSLQSSFDAKQDVLGFTPVPNTRQINGLPLTSDITIDKSAIGLSNVNNTSDENKPISVATQTALDLKASSAHGHAIADVTNLQSSLNGKANTSHTHAISNITNLQTTLNGKANTSHTHEISNITGLQTALDGKLASADLDGYATDSELSSGLAGKANTSHNHTVSNISNFPSVVSYFTNDANYITSAALADYATDAELTAGLATKANTSHTHTVSNITDFPTDLATDSELSSGLATKQNTISLTTTGNSGAATFTDGILNIPNYAGGGGSSGRASPGLISQRYFLASSGTNTTQALTVNQVILQPVYLGNTTTFDALGFHVSTAGTSGAMIRIAIYSSNSNGNPDSLLYDFGQKTTEGAFFHNENVTPFELQGGKIYWIACVAQVSGSTLRAYTGVPYESAITGTNFNTTASGFISSTTVSGAFPSTISLSNNSVTQTPKIGLRVQ